MIPAIIVAGHLAVAVADRPPVVNFEQTCREEAARTNDKFEICVADEKRARDQLARQWSSFDPGARTRCARTSTSGRAESYLELLVCLELDQADREVHGQGTTGLNIMEPERPARERDEARAAAPSRPAPIPRSPQQPVARSAAAPPAVAARAAAPPAAGPPSVAPPAASPPAEPLPLAPSPPMSEPQPTSQAEVLQQSICRSPLGYVLPGCR